ncbi:hypothetical protein GQ55_1G303800 [Panicum hallii var. hallii]|uniref:Uncharacterized protein n=1 Tax=Panicum hallii var. hallii TaxID=1504633 RepID=A0A2T7F950_9POAL|nr:hypothetical protein GQ55_1G303800 [Panicum hallii var. hallii]
MFGRVARRRTTKGCGSCRCPRPPSAGCRARRRPAAAAAGTARAVRSRLAARVPRAGCVTKGTGGGRATRGAVTWDPCRAGGSSAWSAAGPAPPAATSAEREGRGRTNG